MTLKGPVLLALDHAVDLDAAAVAKASPAAAAWPTVDTADAVLESARTRLSDSLSQLDAAGKVPVVRGPAASVIVGAAASEGASLPVVGTQGRSGLPQLPLGSVAESVTGDAPCSVLAVPLHAAPVSKATVT